MNLSDHTPRAPSAYPTGPGQVLCGLLVGVDAVGGDFDFGDPAEGEEQLYEVLGRLFRGLLHDMCDSVGDCRLEHHTLGLEAGQIHAHELAWLQHRSLYGNPPPARSEMQVVPG